MGTPLVIVESPAKARTISRFLGDDYRVEASIGHIRDLVTSHKDHSLGVDTENGFKPIYVVPKEKKAQVKQLREAAALHVQERVSDDEELGHGQRDGRLGGHALRAAGEHDL